MTSTPPSNVTQTKADTDEQALEHASPSPRERTMLNLPTALKLYDLSSSELFCELQLDTRCLIGWSSSKIVVSFRGTASMKNALADVQVRLIFNKQLACTPWLNCWLTHSYTKLQSAEAAVHILPVTMPGMLFHHQLMSFCPCLALAHCRLSKRFGIFVLSPCPGKALRANT